MEEKIVNLEKKLREETQKNEELKKRIDSNNNLNDLNKIILDKEKKINILEEKLSRFPFDLNENEKLMSLVFTSSDQKFIFPVFCKNTDRFNSLENKLYDAYPDYGETENYFIVNGNKIIKSKTLEYNKIKNNDIIVLNQYD